MATATIYVELVGEQVQVWAPVEAIAVAEMRVDPREAARKGSASISGARAGGGRLESVRAARRSLRRFLAWGAPERRRAGAYGRG